MDESEAVSEPEKKGEKTSRRKKVGGFRKRENNKKFSKN